MGIFNWDWKKEKKYTVVEVAVLVEKIKEFNAGAIDKILTQHVDKVFEEWKSNTL